jgi:hypothetical protein
MRSLAGKRQAAMPSSPVAWLADIIREHLAESARGLLWVPVFGALLFAIVTLALRAVRAVLPALSWVAQQILDILVAGLFLFEVVIAAPFRLIRRRPPAVVYAIGDGTVPLANVTRAMLGRGFTRLRKYAGGYGLPLLVSIVLIGWWNSSRCASPDSTHQPCQRPVQEWVSHMTDLFSSTS